MKLYLLRHGETEGNRRRLYYGRTDLPLLPETVTALRENAACYPKAGRYCVSGMLRTVQTLRAIYGDVPYTVIPELREIDFGIFEMHTYEELKDTPAYRRWIGDAEHNRCPDGESAVDLQRRCVRAVETLLARGEDIVCVTHGGAIAAILMYYFGGERYAYSVPPASGVCIDAPDGTPTAWSPVPAEPSERRS